MSYRIAHEGEIFGEYSLPDVRRLLEAGNIEAHDLAQGDAAPEWTPVTQVLNVETGRGGPSRPTNSKPLPSADPPDLPWGLALLLGVLTGALFFVVWDLFEAAWMHRVERGSVALGFYMAAAVLFVASLPASWHSVAHTLLGAPTVAMPYASSIAVSAFAVRLMARFVLRYEICRHYRFHRGLEGHSAGAQGGPGVRLSWLWTLLFGGLYFQYKFNQINERKRALRAWANGV